jgi:hypothetical protein
MAIREPFPTNNKVYVFSSLANLLDKKPANIYNIMAFLSAHFAQS